MPHWFNFQGRIDRSSFWLRHFVLTVVFVFLLSMSVASVGQNNGWVNWVIFAAYAAGSLSTSFKRSYDLGDRWQAPLIVFIPVFNFLVLGFIPGVWGPNKHGYPENWGKKQQRLQERFDYQPRNK
jgi:uncharacterized membrane protein YhaH (DUF805 family)